MSRGFYDQPQPGFTPDDSDVAGEAPGVMSATTRLGPGGRVVIPADIREAMGMKQGDALLVSLENNELRLVTLAASVRELQAITNKYHRKGVSLVDEFIAEKRAEQAREDAE